MACSILIVYGIKLLKGVMKTKFGRLSNLENVDIIAIFVIISFVLALGVNAVFYWGSPREIIAGRIIQGRYTDYLAGTVILLTVILNSLGKIDKKTVIGAIILSVITILATAFVIKYTNNDSFIPFNNASLINWFRVFEVNPFGIILCGVIVILIGLCIYGILYSRRYMLIGVVLVFVLVYSVIMDSYIKDYYEYKNEKIESYIGDICNYIEQNDLSTFSYLRSEADDALDFEYLKLIQFRMPHLEIRIIDDYSKIFNEEVIGIASPQVNEDMFDDRKVICDTGRMMLLE